MAPRAGLEPATNWLTVNCSTNWATEEWKQHTFFKIIKQPIYWRPRPESNWDKRICNPLRNHSATWPIMLLLNHLIASIKQNLSLLGFSPFDINYINHINGIFWIGWLLNSFLNIINELYFFIIVIFLELIISLI